MAPAARKGPKGIGCLIPMRPLRINRNAAMLPIKLPNKTAKIILGKPRKKPNTPVSFTSPNPIPLSYKRYIKKKHPAAVNAPSSDEKRLSLSDMTSLAKPSMNKISTKQSGSLIVLMSINARMISSAIKI